MLGIMFAMCKAEEGSTIIYLISNYKNILMFSRLELILFVLTYKM